VPVFDYGFGMGSRMYGDGDYTYDTRGVMNNLMEALLNGEVSTWAELREAWSSVVDTEIATYNN
jgi:multiple sugar transport system substrate-binding protein